ncbi:fatty-acid amide hydrolase 2-like [Tropilaelaps mercedesae]|uniref:Fatty-acid amide hydrolase 2-like n=1 Tax=Tropilaelaps mercedesae TaxID=418985 RepID=A0A1V9XGB8_9ACAR|nr:fatty-acid amide hydrolase 2-like [Tropilaelaps mercedesae]
MFMKRLRAFLAEALHCFLLFTYHTVKFLWHQGQRDGRKRLPPITDRILIYSGMQIAALIRKKVITSEEVVRVFIARILEVNPLLNAVVTERFEKALEEARRADELVRNSTPSQLAKEKPLLGVPITTKESNSVKGQCADIGSVIHKGERCPQDAVCIRMLRSAGAIPLCVTNVPEMTMWMETSNMTHGRTNNPYDLHRTPGGSSGGEGALLAAAGSVIGVGSDTCGSVRFPSAWCGVFGHKPTAELIDIQGLIPEPHPGQAPFVCVGPMTRYSEDLSPVLRLLARDPSKLQLDTPVDLSKLNVFYTDDEGAAYISSVRSDMRYSVRRVVSHLATTHGCEIQEMRPTELLADGFSLYLSMMERKGVPQTRFMFKMPPKGINPKREFSLKAAGLSYHTLAAIRLSQIDKRYRKKRYASRRREDLNRLEVLDRTLNIMLGDNGVLIFPAGLSAAPFHHASQLHPYGFLSLMAPFTVLKMPVTICPIGLNDEGIPLSVAVASRRFNDRLTLAIARDLEKAFGGWRPPCPVDVYEEMGSK